MESKYKQFEHVPESRLRILNFSYWRRSKIEYSLRGISIVIFKAYQTHQSYWRIKFKQKNEEDLNKFLLDAFSVENIKNESFESQFRNRFKLEAIFIPQTSINDFHGYQVDATLLFVHLLSVHFNFANYFRLLKREIRINATLNVPVPVIGFWIYFYEYIQALKIIKGLNINAVQKLDVFSVDPISRKAFKKYLPSQQLKHTLIFLIHDKFIGGLHKEEFRKLVVISTPIVQSFWRKYEDVISDYLQNVFNNTEQLKLSIFQNENLKLAFYEIFLEDLMYVKVQELLDDTSHTGLFEELPKDVRMKFKPTLMESIKNIVTSYDSIGLLFDRVEILFMDKKPVQKSELFRTNNSWYQIENRYKYYQYGVDDLRSLILSFDALGISDKKSILEKRVLKRWSLHLENLSRELHAPFFYWVKKYNQWYPKFNEFDSAVAEYLIKENRRSNNIEELEIQRLRKAIETLQTHKEEIHLDDYYSNVKLFDFPILQKRWEEAYLVRLNNLGGENVYRRRKMTELGIVDFKSNPTHDSYIYLDEMLRIEQEILDYLPFVKKAFKAALPIRKDVEFDPYRHSIDGVEFDPETFQDPEKWMNGKVLKTLKTKIVKSEVEQINAFALDFSGSMDYDKMRNLFKLCYLVVLGLEDRKTYDAFHFFSNRFYETASFSHEYTNRKLLFKILSKISYIVQGEVVYSGEGGTNMSSGIINCYERINDFAAKVAKNKKETLKSLFVVTDGMPSIGIVNHDSLNKKIEELRTEGDIVIKGIYIKPEGERDTEFMEEIFGKEHYIQTHDFDILLEELIYTMSNAYKKQREDLKKKNKRSKVKRLKYGE